MDGNAGQRHIVGPNAIGQGQFNELEAMEGKAWLEPLAAMAPGDIVVHGHGMAQIGDIEFTLGVEHFAMAQGETVA